MLPHTSNLSDWAAERKFLGRFYQSQGFNQKQGFSNDCGPASLAMVVNMLLFQANPGAQPIDKATVIRSAGLLFWERLPGWVPQVGGATTPWGLAIAFNHLAAQMGLDWQAERKSRARRAHVIEYLTTGRPVTALKIWPGGGAHWVNLVRFSIEKDKLYYLDPNPHFENLAEEKRLQSQDWRSFEADWGRKNWWSQFFGIHNELIVYSRVS